MRDDRVIPSGAAHTAPHHGGVIQRSRLSILAAWIALSALPACALLMASPWIRRGYVSHGHHDMASAYKLIAHIHGIPYHNQRRDAA